MQWRQASWLQEKWWKIQEATIHMKQVFQGFRFQNRWRRPRIVCKDHQKTWSLFRYPIQEWLLCEEIPDAGEASETHSTRTGRKSNGT